MIAWAVDTGTSRNASALARVKLVYPEWRAWVWKWQGSTGRPLSIEHIVGPTSRALWLAHGQGLIAADAYYAPELRRGLRAFPEARDDVDLRIQGGRLRDIYGYTKRLVHLDARPFTLRVSSIGWTWAPSGWLPDLRSGERVIAGLKAVESEHRDGELYVSIPDDGDSHHDESVAVMRALWLVRAGETVVRHQYATHEHRYAGLGSSLSDRMVR